jgi:hypothetical protein
MSGTPVPTVTVQSTAAKVATGVFTEIKGFSGTMLAIGTEMMRIFPDGLIITSAVYGLLIQSRAFLIFSASMLEAAAIFHFIRWISSYVNVTPVTPRGAGKYNAVCRTGFTDPTSPTLYSLSMFSTLIDETDILQHFPSSPIYMISVASAYLFSTLHAQAKDLAALGPTFSIKYYISILSLFFILCVFMCFRIFNSCESTLTVILSVPIGLIVGGLLVQQNLRLFNTSGINLTGIPQMSSVTANGQKLYVCPTAQRQK